MANSLLTGISGLRGHQRMLEVIGNNLANLNTTAFKSSRMVFSDLVYESQRGMQIGTGSRVSSMYANFSQGNLEPTSRDLDVALDGEGFFVAMTSAQELYTRAGTFSVDQSGFLVDTTTGNHIRRVGTIGEPDGVNPAFQSPDDDRLFMPLEASVPGRITTRIDVTGNFASTSTGPVAQRLRTTVPFLTGGAPATAGTLLSDLDSNTVDYSAGDVIQFVGSRPGGVQPSPASLTVSGTTTVGDLLAAIQAAYGGVTATVNLQGHLVVQDPQTGPSGLDVRIMDSPANTGRTDFGLHEFLTLAVGKDADEVLKSLEVFDDRGTAHSLDLKFTKQADNTWTMEVVMDPSEGDVIDGLVSGITLNPDGTFRQVSGSGIGDSRIALQFNSSPTPLTVTLGFGTPGDPQSLRESGGDSLLKTAVDGYEPGKIAQLRIEPDGTVAGVTDNGIVVNIGQLAIATFQSVDGLLSAGNNYYAASVASGPPLIGAAQSGDRGAVRAGQLEGSNVDIAVEFTRLIVAQKGFSANARTITVTDEMLTELTNIIR